MASKARTEACSAAASGVPNLALLLSQASHVLTTELTAGLAELGVTPRSFCVLSTAMTNEVTQLRLAELCGLDKTTMVVTLDELERAGLAERRPSQTDRRARIVSVTPDGQRVVASAGNVVQAIYQDVLTALPLDERDVFVRALVRLVGGRLSSPVRCERPVRRLRESIVPK